MVNLDINGVMRENAIPAEMQKKQAIKQGIAIEGPEKFSQKAQELKMLYINDENIFLKNEDLQYITDWRHEEGYTNAAIVGTVIALTPNVKGVY